MSTKAIRMLREARSLIAEAKDIISANCENDCIDSLLLYGDLVRQGIFTEDNPTGHSGSYHQAAILGSDEAIERLKNSTLSGEDIHRTSAMEYLGDIYYNGLGVEVDLNEALKYYKNADGNGSPNCDIQIAEIKKRVLR